MGGGAGAAQLFRKSIANQVSRVTCCTESHALSFLSTPKPTASRQFSLPLPKLVPNLQSDQWETIAKTVIDFDTYHSAKPFLTNMVSSVEAKRLYSKHKPAGTLFAV